jgi:hypothetical protein
VAYTTIAGVFGTEILSLALCVLDTVVCDADGASRMSLFGISIVVLVFCSV